MCALIGSLINSEFNKKTLCGSSGSQATADCVGSEGLSANAQRRLWTWLCWPRRAHGWTLPLPGRREAGQRETGHGDPGAAFLNKPRHTSVPQACAMKCVSHYPLEEPDFHQQPCICPWSSGRPVGKRAGLPSKHLSFLGSAPPGRGGVGTRAPPSPGPPLPPPSLHV